MTVIPALAALGLQIDAPLRFQPKHHVTGEPMAHANGDPFYIELTGWQSTGARKHRFAREDAARKGRELSAEEDWQDMGLMLARMTLGWGVGGAKDQLLGLDGKVYAFPFSEENAATLFNDPAAVWLRVQAIEFLNTEGNSPAASATA